MIAAVCQRRATGSVSEGRYETGHSHNLTSYLLKFDFFFLLTFTSRIKLGRNERQPRVLLCSVKPEILSVSVLEKNLRKMAIPAKSFKTSQAFLR